MRYKGITREILKELADIAGKENVLSEEEERVRYSWDETCRPRPCLPDVVVKPRDTDTVAKVMRLAHEQTIPVTPRGGWHRSLWRCSAHLWRHPYLAGADE